MIHTGDTPRTIAAALLLTALAACEDAEPCTELPDVYKGEPVRACSYEEYGKTCCTYVTSTGYCYYEVCQIECGELVEELGSCMEDPYAVPR